MIDIKLIRENAEYIQQNCARRGYDVDIAALLKIDAEARQLNQEIEELRAERNRLSKQCAADPAAREKVKTLKVDLADKEKAFDALQEQINEVMVRLPNTLAPDVPDGDDDSGNVEIRKIGTIREFDFKLRDHQELGEMLDILDIARGAKVAQTGFYYWKGKGAILAQALYFWVQRLLVDRGFTMFMTPCLAKERTLFGTGYLPFFADQTYNISGEDLALIGTSEQTLVGYHADDVLDGAELPLMYTAFTPCFRTESGSYGRASRGIFRVHQFHKVEQIIFCRPEESPSGMNSVWKTKNSSFRNSISPITSSTSASATSAPRDTRSMILKPGSRLSAATVKSPATPI